MVRYLASALSAAVGGKPRQRSAQAVGANGSRLLPDAYPVDEHFRGIGAALGIPTARPPHGQVQHRKHPVVGEVERPVVDGERGDLEVRLRAVDVKGGRSSGGAASNGECPSSHCPITQNREHLSHRKMRMMGGCRDTHGVVSGLWRSAGGHVDPALMMANHQLEEQDFVGSPDEEGDPVAPYGAVLESVVNRAREAGVLRPDFGANDLATMIGAVSKVIAISDSDDAVWRRQLGFVLDGGGPTIRGRRARPVRTRRRVRRPTWPPGRRRRRRSLSAARRVR